MRLPGFVIESGRPVIVKGDDETLDYGITYAKLLEPGETIASSGWTVPAGLTKGAEGVVGNVAVVWLSGGTAGQEYEINNIVTTSGGRTYERSFVIRVAAWR